MINYKGSIHISSYYLQKLSRSLALSKCRSDHLVNQVETLFHRLFHLYSLLGNLKAIGWCGVAGISPMSTFELLVAMLLQMDVAHTQ